VEIFTGQGAPPVSATQGANFAIDTAVVVDSSRKFATGDNATGGK
jgi:hypothetical protein